VNVAAGVPVRLRAATRHFGDKVALDGVDLTVAAGERVALIGPSGSGKSTLLALVAGSLAATGGDVEVAGRSIAAMRRRELRRHRARCGIIPQNAALVPQLSVYRNVINGLLPHWPWYKSALCALIPLEQDRAQEWLARVGLVGQDEQLAATLSGGEQQRVAVARALIAGPSLILADEPTASLDPTNAAQVTALIADRNGATLIMSTHWVSVVRDRVSRLVGLRDGRVVLDAPAEDVDDEALDELYRGSDERR
jgi:phosphonate transport system ATP-binding protein